MANCLTKKQLVMAELINKLYKVKDNIAGKVFQKKSREFRLFFVIILIVVVLFFS